MMLLDRNCTGYRSIDDIKNKILSVDQLNLFNLRWNMSHSVHPLVGYKETAKQT